MEFIETNNAKEVFTVGADYEGLNDKKKKEVLETLFNWVYSEMNKL
jgi:hypothetical protein